MPPRSPAASVTARSRHRARRPGPRRSRERLPPMKKEPTSMPTPTTSCAHRNGVDAASARELRQGGRRQHQEHRARRRGRSRQRSRGRAGFDCAGVRPGASMSQIGMRSVPKLVESMSASTARAPSRAGPVRAAPASRSISTVRACPMRPARGSVARRNGLPRAAGQTAGQTRMSAGDASGRHPVTERGRCSAAMSSGMVRPVSSAMSRDPHLEGPERPEGRRRTERARKLVDVDERRLVDDEARRRERLAGVPRRDLPELQRDPDAAVRRVVVGQHRAR